MKRKLALSFLFMFTLGLTAPVMSNTMMQEPEKQECEKKEKKDCDKEKKECDKKAEKKDCDKDKE
ncbi:MAG: hypothetical protein ACOCPW_05465 [Marinilabiliaceae bacterium]